MTETITAPAFWYPMREDRTFGEPEALENFTLRVYNGDELKAEAGIADLAIWHPPRDQDRVDMREVENMLRESADLVAKKECRVGLDFTKNPPGYFCDRYTCRSDIGYACDKYLVSFPGKGSTAVCVCTYTIMV
jgi:hypothetical protein